MSDVIFIIARLAWYVLAPGHLLLLILLFGVSRLAATRGRRGMVPVTLAAAGLVAITILPLGSWLVAPLENRFPKTPGKFDRVDGIVLLGGAVEPGRATGEAGLNGSAERVTGFVALARDYPEARLLVTSGEAALFPQGRSEAESTAMLLARLGLAADRLLLEPRSRNTYENALMARETAKPRAGERWLLVTSASHMPRAVGSFRAAGWPVTPHPVDFDSGEYEVALAANLGRLTSAAKEWVGLIAYRLMGRTTALLPEPESEALAPTD